MIIPGSEDKAFVQSSHLEEELIPLDQSPPPYSHLPQDLSTEPTQPLNLPLDLVPTNYLYINENNHDTKRNILLDLSIPRPSASALPVTGTCEGQGIPHLTLDSHNGTVSWEVWVLRANLERSVVAHGDDQPARLHFHTHNGIVNALVHFHPSTVNPRPFLSIEARAHNGSIAIAIPRSFRGQLTLRTHNGRLLLSSALASRAVELSTFDRTQSYFVGERPSSGKWHTGTSDDGDEVDGLIGSCHNGDVKVSYDDELELEDVSSTKGPGFFSSLFNAMGF